MDVPGLLYRGAVPPLPILNAVLGLGGGDAGMSPGASWQPFQLTEAEYREVVRALVVMDLAVVRATSTARFVPDRIATDDTLADSRSFVEWIRRVKRSHRDP